MVGIIETVNPVYNSNMTWHVFNLTARAPFASFRTYREAVFDAQTRIGTDNRPERLHAGFYSVHGEHSQLDIATTRAAHIQGYPWADRLKTLTDAALLWNEQQEQPGPVPVDTCFELRGRGLVPHARVRLYGIEAELISYPFPSPYGASIMVRVPDEPGTLTEAANCAAIHVNQTEAR